MGYEWTELPNSLQDSIIMNYVRLQERSNSADTSMVLWALGEMEAPLDSPTSVPAYFLAGLMDCTQRSLAVARPHELSKIVWGLSGSRVTWNMLPASMRW